MKSVQLVALLLVVLYVGQSFAFNPKIYGKFHIQITNNLSRSNLIFRCKSKNDVIGNKVLDRGQSYAFSFHMNFWKTTLFFCHIWQGQLYRYHRVFDAFRPNLNFIYDVCRDEWCRWVARDDGIYTYDGLKKVYVLKYPWEILPSGYSGEMSPEMSPL